MRMLLPVAILALTLTACDITYDEVTGRVVEKQVNSGSIPAGDVSVPYEDYLLLIAPTDGGEAEWHNVGYTAYQACEVDQRFHQDTEGSISCVNG